MSDYSHDLSSLFPPSNVSLMSKDGIHEAVEAYFKDKKNAQLSGKAQTGEGAGEEIEREAQTGEGAGAEIESKLDITAVDNQTEGSASKISNVDVCQHNIKNEQKNKKYVTQMAHLANSLAMLEEKLIMYSVQSLQEKVEVGDKAVSLLQQAIDDIKALRARVDYVEVEMIDLKEEVYSAHHRIKTHERVIQKILGPEGDDLIQQYDHDSDGVQSSQAAEPQKNSPTNSCA